MKKFLYLLLPIIFLLTGCSNNSDTKSSNTNLTNIIPNGQNTQNTNIERISVTLDNQNNISNNNIITNEVENTNTTTNNTNTTNTNNNTNNNTENSSTDNTKKEPKEIELSSFSTNILTSDPHRNNNIQITCNKLNNHIVKPNETFSFIGLIGKSTESKGYEKANVINSEGDTIKGLGGGNCQVSSTLYNAVSKVPELEVTERHNHGAEVHYVPIGKDAAVAYGSMDFKFKNNSSNKIKITASSNDKEITIKIFKINY